MPTLLLVRHAVTPTTGKRLYGRKPGVDLSDEGRGQASRVGAHLAAADLAAVYSSPMERARQTAAPIARPHGLRVRVREELNEVDYGDWTDRPLGQLRRRNDWAVIQQTPSRFTFPGGESLRAAQARFVDGLETIAAAHKPAHVVAVVSHADLIRLAIAHYSGTPMDLFQRLVVAPASTTTIHLSAATPPVVVSTNVPPPPARSDDA